jgi:hypothetical protein
VVKRELKTGTLVQRWRGELGAEFGWWCPESWDGSVPILRSCKAAVGFDFTAKETTRPFPKPIAPFGLTWFCPQ